MNRKNLSMKRLVLILVTVFVIFSTIGPVSAAERDNTPQYVPSTLENIPGVRYIHTATAANTTDNYTYLDHPLLDDDPSAIVFATQNWNPGGVGNKYNDHPIGVWYDTLEKKWSVFNQDDTSIMPEDAAFNILIPAADAPAFIHTATPANTTFNYTLIDHPLTNNNPNAILMVTQNWNPGGGGTGIYNDQPIGVWYDSMEKKWYINGPWR